VVADLLAHSIDAPATFVYPGDNIEPELIQMPHTPLQPAVSLDELQQESKRDPILTTLRTYIRSGWPVKVPDELTPFTRVRDKLLCCVALWCLGACVHAYYQWHMRGTWAL